MSQNLSRLLNNKDLVRHFLNNVLNFKHNSLRNIIELIVDGELGIVNYDQSAQTINSTKFRDSNYLNEQVRWQLREQIINEILTLKRLEDDEQIKLGKGGALPNSELIAERQAFIIIGLPASGKSHLASIIADNYGAIIIDSDYIKRKLPEFKKHLYGATIVHEESSQITFGFRISNSNNIRSIYEQALIKQYNIVIPKIGNSPKSILSLARTLKEKNKYSVHLISIELLKRNATIRAIHRYHKTKRYVPLGLIFDGYGNDPCLSYYYLRCKHMKDFVSFGSICTDVPIGSKPFCSDFYKKSPILSEEFGFEIKNLILQ